MTKLKTKKALNLQVGDLVSSEYREGSLIAMIMEIESRDQEPAEWSTWNQQTDFRGKTVKWEYLWSSTANQVYFCFLLSGTQKDIESVGKIKPGRVVFSDDSEIYKHLKILNKKRKKRLSVSVGNI